MRVTARRGAWASSEIRFAAPAARTPERPLRVAVPAHHAPECRRARRAGAVGPPPRDQPRTSSSRPRRRCGSWWPPAANFIQICEAEPNFTSWRPAPNDGERRAGGPTVGGAQRQPRPECGRLDRATWCRATRNNSFACAFAPWCYSQLGIRACSDAQVRPVRFLEYANRAIDERDRDCLVGEFPSRQGGHAAVGRGGHVAAFRV